MSNSLREIQNEIAELNKKRKEFAIRAEHARLKKENDDLIAAKDANNYNLITRILSRSKKSATQGIAGETGILGYLINIFSILFNKNSKDTLKVDEHRPHETTKHSLQKLTEKVQIDVDFIEVDRFIDEVAATNGPKFINLKFADPNVPFPNDDFAVMINGQNLVNNVVADPIRNAPHGQPINLGQNADQINKLSLPGIISAIFENKNGLLGNQNQGLNDAKKSEIAVQAVAKAYTAKKYLRGKDVTKDKLLKVAENAKRQVILYLKTSKYLDELYASTTKRNAAGVVIPDSPADKAKFKLAKDALSRSVLGTEFLNNMPSGNKLKFANLNKNLADKLLKINNYYDKATQTDDNVDRENVRKELMFCLNNLYEVESEADSLYREARKDKIVHRETKAELKDIIEHNKPLQNNGNINIRDIQQIQDDHRYIILKVADQQKSMLEKMEKEYADLIGKWVQIDMLNNRAHPPLSPAEIQIVAGEADLLLEIEQKRRDCQNIIYTFAKELAREEKSKSLKTGFGD
jgi:hypothetical protein